MAKPLTDNHFRTFVANLEQVLNRHAEAPDADQDRLTRQRRQLRDLIRLEAEFRDALVQHRSGPAVFQAFVSYICDTRRNILAQRPFFRERQVLFTRKISGALKVRNAEALYGFRYNWGFVDWVVKSRRWAQGSDIRKLAKQISDLRTEILEQNLPLAISQAKIFYSNTPRSHLSYMDIVQIHAQGLLLAIDKFVPPNDARMSEANSLQAYRKFRPVAIGIMARDRVNAYSETPVHFFPKQRLIRYRANKALRTQTGPEVDWQEVCEQVNSDLRDSGVRTDPEELQSLVAQGSTVSADTSPDPEGETILETHPDDLDRSPAEVIEAQQAVESLRSAVSGLDLVSKKLLRLKGIQP